MKRPRLKRSLSIMYLFIFAALAFLFFTNDFGLLDLRKTSVVIGVGLDMEEDEVVLTAQLAVPQPAENGENTKFNVVSGKGNSVAAALNEVNVKTGFYPKLVFCKLIILGESCFGEDITKLLDYFYRNEYTGLTLNVAACQGKAYELIAQQFPCGNSATDVIDKLLSSEAQASGNVAATNVKEIGEKLFSKSESAYMPYLENGILDKQEGENGSGGNSQSGSSGNSPSSGSGGGGQQCNESELTCNKCAVFSKGYFKGVLPVEQTFALNLIFNEVRHAFVESGGDGEMKILGLRNCNGKVDLKIENGEPQVLIKFKAIAKIQDGDKGFSPEEVKKAVVEKEVLREGERSIGKMFESLFESVRALDSDILGLKTMLNKKFYKQYGQYADGLIGSAKLKCEVSLKSSA